jgi:aspartate/methionine/tyrosine aminotransferase
MHYSFLQRTILTREVAMNQLAEELNEVLAGTVAERLFSEMGRHMYFPKGIITQGAEASERAYRFNATIGMAYEHGQPMMLDALRKELPGLTPTEAVAYAPTGGVLELRKAWKAALYKKNPSLEKKNISLPVVVPGLTAAVSYICDLFVEPGDTVIVPDLHWPNYRLIIEERKMAAGITYPLFSGNAFNVEALLEGVRQAGQRRGKAIIVLNFPNNPTGYSLTLEEADRIANGLLEIARGGTDILAIADDAYFGLQYENNLLCESMFARLTNLHPNILAVKADGPTKEDYVWGFRMGFVTFGGRDLTDQQYDALTKKLTGIIRSSVSSSCSLSQNLLLKALTYEGYDAQKAGYRAVLEGRYKAMKKKLASMKLPGGLEPMPFNSGYFMSFYCEGFSAEALRKKLLDEMGIGTVSLLDRYLRVAFSSVEEKDVDDLCEAIAQVVAELQA